MILDVHRLFLRSRIVPGGVFDDGVYGQLACFERSSKVVCSPLKKESKKTNNEMAVLTTILDRVVLRLALPRAVRLCIRTHKDIGIFDRGTGELPDGKQFSTAHSTSTQLNSAQLSSI